MSFESCVKLQLLKKKKEKLKNPHFKNVHHQNKRPTEQVMSSLDVLDLILKFYNCALEYFNLKEYFDGALVFN